jgi:RNA polymerase sigma-70 factor (ECF subfamily)
MAQKNMPAAPGMRNRCGAGALSCQTATEVSLSGPFQRDLVGLVPKLRRFACSLAGNQADGDDLVQSACEKALRNQAQFSMGTRMDSWMYRIIQTLWLDDLRKRKVRGVTVDPADIEVGDEGKAAGLPEHRMMLARTSAAMATLPEPQRVVLSLVAVEGLSYRETAEVLEVPVGTVMSRLSRAREALLPQLGLSRGGRQ